MRLLFPHLRRLTSIAWLTIALCTLSVLFTIRDSIVLGADSIASLLENQMIGPVVKKTSQMGCIADKFTTPMTLKLMEHERTQTESWAKEKFLLFEPQYGTNNQFIAIVQAQLWAKALGRRLILPPILTPRVSAFVNYDNTSGYSTIDQKGWIDFDSFFYMEGKTASEHFRSKNFVALPGAELPPISYRAFAKLLQESPSDANVPPLRRMLHLTRRAVFDTSTEVLTAYLRQEVPSFFPNSTTSWDGLDGALELVDLRKHFGGSSHPEKIQRLLGGCSESILAVDGLFFANIIDADTQTLMESVIKLTPEVSKLVLEIKTKLIEELGTEKYGCYHIRQGDFRHMCQELESGNTLVWGSFQTAVLEYLCLVQSDDLDRELHFDSRPALILSDDPEALQPAIDNAPNKTVDSRWVSNTIEKASDLRGQESKLLSLIVDQQLCAAAYLTVLSKFSTVSRFVMGLQNRNFKAFRYWVTPAIRSMMTNTRNHDASKLNRKFWNDKMIRLLNARKSPQNAVIVTGVTYEYRSHLINFICNLRKVGLSNHFVVAALDEPMYAWGIQRDLPIFLADTAPAGRTTTSRTVGFLNETLTNFKSRIILKVLLAGYSVIWSDVDITWFENPLMSLQTYLEPSFRGIVLQSDAPFVENGEMDAQPHPTATFVNSSWSWRINSGLCVAKNEPMVKQAFRDIVRHTKTGRKSEHASFDAVLCEAPSMRGENSCTYTSRRRFPTEELPILSLDRFSYPNGAILVGPRNKNAYELGKNQFEAYTKKKLASAHNNWIVGGNLKQGRQIDRGWWFVNDDGKENLLCSANMRFEGLNESSALLSEE